MERMTKHGSEFCCKRWRMLTWLVEQGFKPIKTIPDATKPYYKNWIFENSIELENKIDEYFSEVVGKK